MEVARGRGTSGTAPTEYADDDCGDGDVWRLLSARGGGHCLPRPSLPNPTSHDHVRRGQFRIDPPPSFISHTHIPVFGIEDQEEEGGLFPNLTRWKIEALGNKS